MISANRFWLSTHHLWRDYMDEGATSDERRTAILGEFRKMSPLAQREITAELIQLIAKLSEISSAVRSELPSLANS